MPSRIQKLPKGRKRIHSLLSISKHYTLERVANINFKYVETQGVLNKDHLPYLRFAVWENQVSNPQLPSTSAGFSPRRVLGAPSDLEMQLETFFYSTESPGVSLRASKIKCINFLN